MKGRPIRGMWPLVVGLLVTGMLALVAQRVGAAGSRLEAAQERPGEREVLAALQAQHLAYWSGDVAGVDRLTAEEFYRIGQDGLRTTKLQHLAAMRASRLLPAPPSVQDEIDVRLYGEVAVVTLRDHRPGLVGSITRSTYVFVRRDGRWVVAALQQTAATR